MRAAIAPIVAPVRWEAAKAENAEISARVGQHLRAHALGKRLLGGGFVAGAQQ